MSPNLTRRLNHLFTQHQLWAVLIALVYFTLNLFQAPLYNVGYADSDELLTVAFSPGIAHPPGYPLYILLLSLFLKLPFPAVSIAFKGHVFTALLASVTLSLVYLSLVRLSRLIQTKKPFNYVLISPAFEAWWFALISTATLAFTFQFWLYAHITEKYSLAALFVSLWLYLTVILLSQKSPSMRLWLVYFGLIGLSLSHLQTLALLLPASIYLFYQKRPRPLPQLAALGFITLVVSFLLPYGLVFLFNSQNPPVSWRFEPSLTGLYDLITRRDFSGLRYASGKQVGAYFDQLDLNKFSGGALAYGKILITHMGLWSILLFALALRFGRARLKSGYLTFILAAGLLSIGLAGYLGYPEDWGSRAITLRQYIPGFVSLSVFIYLGWYELTKRLLAAGRLLMPRLSPLLLLLLPSILIGYHFYSNIRLVDLSGYDLISRRYRDMLLDFPSNSLVTCYSDPACFALLYEQKVNDLRPDVDVLPLAYPLVNHLAQDPNLRLFTATYQNNPYLTVDAITSNLGRRPVVAVELSTVYYNLLGINGPFMYYLPQGSYGLFSFDMPETHPNPITPDIQPWLDLSLSELDPMRVFHQNTVARDLILNGTLYLKMDHRDWSLNTLNLASNLFHRLGQEEQSQFATLRNEIERYQPDPNFATGSTIPSSEELIGFAQRFYDNNQINRAFTYAHAAVSRDPTNAALRVWLGKIYEALGDLDFAQIEYQNALILEPDHPEAQANLNRLNLPTSL